MSLHSKAPVKMSTLGNRSGGTPTGRRLLGAADRLPLVAAPTFALMALLSATDGGVEMLCASMQDVSPLSGMATMYALMSVFHLAPWLQLICGRKPGSGRS